MPWKDPRTLESPLDCKEIQPVHQSRSVLSVHWKDWCWSWSSNTLATWCENLTHWKRPWCWERLKAGGERHDRGWDSWLASLTQWTWVCANSGKVVKDREAWRATVYGVTKSQTQLCDLTAITTIVKMQIKMRFLSYGIKKIYSSHI